MGNLLKMDNEITPQEIVFLIPTCVKYSDKTEAVRETWAKQLAALGFRYLFLIGRPELQQAEVDGDILYAPCKDDYESLLLKLVLGYEFLHKNMDFKYVYKIDDDCYPNLKKLVEEILPQLAGKQYIGGATHPFGKNMIDNWHFGKCSDPRFDQSYKYNVAPFEFAKGGYGYFLHRDILPYLFELKDELRSELKRYIYSYEDVRIAEILEKHGISVSSFRNYSIIPGSGYNNSKHYLVYDIQNPGLMKLIKRQRTEAKKPLPENSYLNHYFDHIYVVNLKHQTADRLIIVKHLRQYGVDFEILEATNGYAGEPLDRFKAYQERELGDFKRYPEYSEIEKRRNHGYIESAGAMGYIYTYLRILKDAKKGRYKRFLILEDDILLSKNFESKFKSFIESIDEDWKILQLGVSQYGWDSVDIDTAAKKGFYFPRTIDTCGSFAVAYDSTIIDELIEAESAFEAPFDHLPMGELYERYLRKCFVAFPNIVMADVSDSTIRGERSQYDHSKIMKWKLENFDYPLSKPSISAIITSENNLKYYSNFSKAKQLPFNLRLFFNSSDGLRPLHNAESLNAAENEIQPLDTPVFLSESDYLVTTDEREILTEDDIVKFIEYKLAIRKKNKTPIKEIETHKRSVKKDRVSVIIPTYKRPKSLKSALASVVAQDYPDTEVLVVSDNGTNSEFAEETRQIVSSFDDQNANCNVVLLEHSVNRNGAAARNTGIQNSTGEYICFLDDDDIYLPGRLTKSIEVLKTTSKTVGAVYCGYFGWNSPKNDLSRYKTGNLTLEILLLDFKKHYLHTNTATYKREAVLTINGFDESYRRHQDLEFNLRFFEQYTIEAVRELLVQINPELTDINNRVYDENMMKIKQKFLNQFSYMIEIYDHSLATAIHEAHQREAKIFISDKDAFIGISGVNPNEGFAHILKSDILKDNYNVLRCNYDAAMGSISNLIGTPIKKSPLQKLSAYNVLADTFTKLQEK